MRNPNVENRAVWCLLHMLEGMTRYLDPRDVVHLSRACVPLRNRLRQSSYVWEVALKNHAPSRSAPSCVVRKPRALVVLYFTKECTTCGDETSNPIQDELAVRLCDRCTRTELISVPNQPLEYVYDFRGNGTGIACWRTDVVFRRDPPDQRKPVTLWTPLATCANPVTYFPQTLNLLEPSWLDPQIQRLKFQAEKRVNDGELRAERATRRRRTQHSVVQNENAPWLPTTHAEESPSGPYPTASRRNTSKKSAGRSRTTRKPQ